ncbi:MAG: hypothetical protein LBI70_03515 [Rickettsiales bacterium]|nr:hypothetical protein [Rickettsiales bacterium]
MAAAPSVATAEFCAMLDSVLKQCENTALVGITHNLGLV